MRSFPAALSTRLAARDGVSPRVMLWCEARNRSTGAVETLGLWTGDDHRTITVGGAPRLYHGAGAILEIPPLRAAATLEVRMQSVTLSPLSPEVEQLIRGYEPRFAPAEIHVAHLDPGTDGLIAEPVRWWRGYIDAVSFGTGAAGGGSSVEVTLASAARDLTRVLRRYKSDRSLRDRASTDRLRRYADVSGVVETLWGEEGASGPKGSGGTQGGGGDVDRYGAPYQRPEAPTDRRGWR